MVFEEGNDFVDELDIGVSSALGLADLLRIATPLLNEIVDVQHCVEDRFVRRLRGRARSCTPAELRMDRRRGNPVRQNRREGDRSGCGWEVRLDLPRHVQRTRRVRAGWVTRLVGCRSRKSRGGATSWLIVFMVGAGYYQPDQARHGQWRGTDVAVPRGGGARGSRQPPRKPARYDADGSSFQY